jgi:hypothetical protein
MKTKIYSIVLALICISLSLAVNGFAAEEPVRGWYDPINDWFVYEWERPGQGTITGIDDPPNKIDPMIALSISYDKKSKEYNYSYKFTNREGKQLLYNIIIEYYSPISDATAPSNDWHITPNYRDLNELHWAKTLGELHGIPPGETVGGFSFKSHGPPAILNAVFFGKRRVRVDMPGDYDTFELMYSYERVANKLEEQYSEKFKDVVLKTVAPGPIPEELIPADFLQGIIDMKHEAMELGWVTNEGIKDSLDMKLEAALKKFQSGNTKAAKNILGAFINEVEAQGCESYADCPKGKHLTPEAYALLKFNAQYLIDNLK